MGPLAHAAALAHALRTLLPVQDILDGRVESCEPPPWCSRRGWDGFLLALDDAELGRCEAEGLGSRVASLPGAPRDLITLAADVVTATHLPALARGSRPPPEPTLRAV